MPTKRVNPNLSEGQDGDLFELIKANVRGHVRNYGDWQRLSQASGVAVSTISNLAYGVSSPQLRTVIKLMEAMGRAQELRKAFASEDPVFTEAALRGAPKKVRERYEARQRAAEMRKLDRGSKS